MIQATRVTVGTSPTRLDAASASDATDSYNQSVLIRNRGAVSIFLGGPSVGAGDGFELEASAQLALDISGSDKVYGVVATGSALCHVVQAGL